MKKSTLFSLILFLASQSLVFAQDVCEEMMKFNDYAKNHNRTSRMTMTMSPMGQTQITESDGKGRFHMTMAMETPMQLKMESVLTGNQLYTKKDDEDWKAQDLDSVQIASMKQKWQNNQLQFFKNCKKLDNETIGGQEYRVYSGDFDYEKMRDYMGQNNEAQQSLAMLQNMDIKMTFYVNKKDDLERAKMKMNVQGMSIDADMVYEYDLPIVINIPPPPAPKKD
ncbi:MAG: hypothetical protein JNL70_06040 [Saprospiraceae bacterium]|nr:hypothetical protein [Saprospiraceae bacterium]